MASFPGPTTSTRSVILNSVYDYDPLPQNDGLGDIVVKVLEILVQALSPRVTIMVGAAPIVTVAGAVSSSADGGQDVNNIPELGERIKR